MKKIFMLRYLVMARRTKMELYESRDGNPPHAPLHYFKGDTNALIKKAIKGDTINNKKLEDIIKFVLSASQHKKMKTYKGKAKDIFKTPDPHALVQYFKDDITAFNSEKRSKIAKKGIINNALSGYLMSHLASKEVRTHFIGCISERQQLIRKLNMFPLEVVVRNIAAGSICKRLGLKEGKELPRAIVEYYYKNDDLGDPMVSENHIAAFNWASNQELKEIYTISLRVNDILRELFNNANIILVDFKLEYGKDGEGNIILADEISPDSCRLWDQTTLDKMDKDRFRHNLGGEAEAYAEVARRLGVYPPT